MSRAVYCLDVTTFGNGGAGKRMEFLDWITRKVRGVGEAPSDTAASKLQTEQAAGGIELIGAWREINGGRAFSLYACDGGWTVGWRRMLELYQGVPSSLFLSEINGVRHSATTLALLAAAASPARHDMAPGRYAVLERATVRAGTELDHLAMVREHQERAVATHGFRLAGLYEVGFGDSRVCTLWTGDDLPDLASWPTPATGFVFEPVQISILSSHPGPTLAGGST